VVYDVLFGLREEAIERPEQFRNRGPSRAGRGVLKALR
jgi:hypothetical protein